MYADQAGYYDICLLIYHSADYRNLPDVRNTWSNLIDQVHNKAISEGHNAPWELVAYKVEDIGRRVALNENVFPVNIVLQMLLQYDVSQYTHDPNGPRIAANGHELLLCSNLLWPIDVFVKLNAPFELLVATLEAMWYAQEPPFNTRSSRKLLIKWMIYTVEQWGQVSRRQGLKYGGTENAIGLADCLRVVLGSGELGGGRDGGAEEAAWVERAREVREEVEEAAR